VVIAIIPDIIDAFRALHRLSKGKSVVQLTSAPLAQGGAKGPMEPGKPTIRVNQRSNIKTKKTNQVFVDSRILENDNFLQCTKACRSDPFILLVLSRLMEIWKDCSRQIA
jgi:hypothetical protein